MSSKESVKNRPIWIPVVAGLIVKNNKVLLGLRPKGGSLPGVWEFPGGKIEVDELPEEGLKRELKEELDIDCEVGDLIKSVTHFYTEKAILILFFSVNFWKGELKSKHHEKIDWFNIEELQTIKLPDANKKILNSLIKHLKSKK